MFLIAIIDHFLCHFLQENIYCKLRKRFINKKYDFDDISFVKAN